MSIGVRRLPTLAILLSLAVMSLPLFAHAGVAANLMCAGCQIPPPTAQDPRPQCITVTCSDTEAGGITTGKCATPALCKAVSYSGGIGGGSGVDSGLSSLGGILGQLLGKLMQPSPSSGGGGSSPAGTPGTVGASGCQGSYFQTSDITQLSNPCAQYAPPASPLSPVGGSGTSTCDTLSQLLGTCGTTPSACTVLSVSCPAGFDTVAQTGTDASGCPLPSQCVLSTTQTNQNGNTSVNPVVSTGATTSLSGLGSPLPLTPGLTNGIGGDITLLTNGATVFGNSQSLANNTGVAGFFGSDTFGSNQPQGIAAQICQARPWAAGFLSNVLPVNFFDGLCTARGYQVGTPPSAAPAPVVQLQQTQPAPKPATPTPATTTPTVKPQVQIWAVPATVPLATRTSIFWNTQGVTSCTETSPDGSFNQASLSGGAATVPLTGATTFTISCLDTAGNPVTGYVTVNLSI